MARPEAPKPDRFTGLPPGVAVGPLGRRLVAYLVDRIVPGVVALLTLVPGDGESASTGLVTVGLLLILVWSLVVWWMTATRAASPGMRLMKLQLVGFTNGRPVGWGRVLLRALVLGVLTATGLGLALMLVLLLRHPRHQGWHDLAANAVLIKQRPLPPRSAAGSPAVTSARPAPRADATSAATAGTAAQAPSSPLTAGVAAAGSSDSSVSSVSSVAGGAGGAPAAPVPLTAPGAGSPATVASGPTPGATRLATHSNGGATVAPPTDPTAEAAAAGRSTTTWTAQLDDGRELTVHGLVLLGRNPQPRPGEETAQLVKIADETRTVSKSHLALDVDERGLFLIDRGSTNGSTVTEPGGQRTRCAPWDATYLSDGAVVTMGDHRLTVRRS